jgi:hypothetical protein
VWLLCAIAVNPAPAAETEQAAFRVKYVAEGAVYLAGGRSAGLVQGQKLSVRRPDPGPGEPAAIAELEIVSVASTSAVCSILSATGEIRPGDMAYLSARDAELLKIQQDSKELRRYPQIISFTEGDPLDAEARTYVPRPPLPEINRKRGRFGLEYSGIRDPGNSGLSSYQVGLVLRTDMTRIGGTYWNFSGYYRGRLNSRNRGAGQETLTDLINRTYHLSLTYNNPDSRWVAGAGRLYLPWATSLSTIDGGYFGRRVGSLATVGVFAGSTPDPTSWNYDPDRQIAGSFVNFEGGSFESFRFTNTFGVAFSRLRWKPEREFGFFENGFFYKRYLSVYHNMETDLVENGVQLSRSFLTVRMQPSRFVSFDISENYFRDIPTFDPRLVGTGLLDRLLFQGLSGGVRFELPFRMSPYFNVGRSSKSGDSRASWNQLAGVTLRRIWRTELRADLRFSRFDSSYGRGSYRSLSLSREFGETLRLDVQAGQQNFSSALSSQSKARWINASGDWFLGRHYFLGGGFTSYRGRVQSYDQWFVNLGYRF